MSELHATIAVIFLLGILLALSRMIQIQMRRMTELNQFLAYAAPLMAQLKQSIQLMNESLPSATEAVNVLADAMRNIGLNTDLWTHDPYDLNRQTGALLIKEAEDE